MDKVEFTCPDCLVRISLTKNDIRQEAIKRVLEILDAYTIDFNPCDVIYIYVKDKIKKEFGVKE